MVDVADLTPKSTLAQMESRYRGLLEAAPDAMVVVNGAGEIVLLNLQAEKQFGYHRDELVGQQVANIIPTGFAERIIADDLRSVADALAQQIGTGLELVALRKDGTEFPIELMLSPLDGSDGILVTAAIRDISVRKAAESALLQSEAWYRMLADSLPHLVWTCRADGPCDYLSPRWVEYTGIPESDQLGYRWLEQLHPDDRDRVIAEWTEAAAHGENFDIEFRIRRADGAFRWFKTRAIPLRNNDGQLVKWFGSNSDVDDSKRAQDELRASNERLAHLAALVESSDDAILSKGIDGTILSWNQGAERLYGYTCQEIIGRPISMLLPPDRPHEVEEILRKLKRGEEIAHFETVRIRKDGSLIDVSVTVSPIRDADGKLTGASTIARDIGARKTAEASLARKAAELARSNEELGQFAYIASHDLQEPLRMVASYTQLLSRRYKGRLDADADEFIAFAVDGASRMQRLIEDLLAYSRVGTRGMDLVSTSSEEAFGQALVNLRGSIEESGAKVTHDPLPEVRADEPQMVQLFQNLVGNAIKYRRAGVPRVHVSAARDSGGIWRYSVKDNGIGIEPQYFEKIFGMFQRLHKRDEFSGTGIGLAICKKIVERHGGTISVESRPGRGSTFHFTLVGSGALL